MKKIIYLFKLKEDEKTLFELELKEYFNDNTKNTKTIMTNVDVDVESTIFTRYKLDVKYSCDSIDQIVDILEKSQFSLDNYKIIWAKNEDCYYEYSKQIENVRKIGNSIIGEFNLKNPSCVYGITYAFNQYHFGKIYVHNNSWMKHINKPKSYSYSLDVRLAKTLINIASKGNHDCKIVDPCCGVGTIVLEGLYMGYNIEGYEINSLVAQNAIYNVEYYGYRNSIINLDMFDIKKLYDVAILDIPYGVCDVVEESYQLQLIKGCYNITDKLILITSFEFKDKIETINYQVLDEAFVKKANFKRYIYLCQKNK